LTWPENPTGGPLGDGRNATATDRPESVDALRGVVLDRVAGGHALYPQGGCSALDYGGIPRSPGVAVDTRALDRVIDYPAADMTVTVEAGITLSTLQGVLAGENQRLLIEAPHPDRATLGGIYATNTCGPRRFGSGRPRDQVIGVSFVTADGALVKGGGRVVKNVAGYDFPRLLTGSLGMLGVIAQLTLKVRPRPEATAVVWVPLRGVEEIGPALDLLHTSSTRPMALELLNPPAARFVAAGSGFASDGWVLAAGFEDNAPSVAWQIDRFRTELGRVDAVALEGADAEPLWAALSGFQDAPLGPLGFVAGMRPSAVAAFVRGLDAGRWAVQAHAGSGVVRAFLLETPELHAAASALPGPEVSNEVSTLRAAAIVAGGALTLNRCPPAWKGPLKVWGDPRPDWPLAERVKKAFDPRGVMNPGRFIGTI